MISLPLSNSQTAVAIEVPKDARDYYVCNVVFENIKTIRLKTDRGDEVIELPNTTSKSQVDILGLFSTDTGEIDFWPEDELVRAKFTTFEGSIYFNYETEMYLVGQGECKTARESFISLLKSKIYPEYPYRENPHGVEPNVPPESDTQKKYNAIDKFEKWQSAQSKVLPKKFLILKVK